MRRSIFVIINATSGAGKRQDELQQAMEILRNSNSEVDLTVSNTGKEVITAAKRAISKEATVIVVGGGDGTVSSVAALLVGTDIHLGVLPLGTLNHFAKDTGIPTNIAEAAALIISGEARAIDVGEVNGRYFINNASLGIYPRIARKRLNQQSEFGWGKWTSFTHAALAVLFVYRLLKVRLRFGDEDISSRVPFLFVGNNQYIMEGFRVGARDRLDGGVLSLYFVRHSGRFRLFVLAFRALVGRLSQAKDFETRLVEELMVESHRNSIHVGCDGEVCEMTPPLNFRTHPKSLWIISPPPTANAV